MTSLPIQPAHPSRMSALLDTIVVTLAALAAGVLVFLPAFGFLSAKLFGFNLVGADTFALHATVMLAFAGALLASRSGMQLALVTADENEAGWPGMARRSGILWLSTLVQTAYVWATLSYCLIGLGPEEMAWFVPVRVFAFAMPLGFLVIIFGDIVRTRLPLPFKLGAIVAALAGTVLAGGSVANVLGFFGATSADAWNEVAAVFGPAARWPLCILLVLFAFLGMPLFVCFGGLAAVLFVGSGSVTELAVVESFAMLKSQSIAAIPLFTLAGFIMSGSRSGERLVRLFKAAFGRLPGGSAIAVVLVFTFFSTFTGSSSVAVLALGPVLALALTGSGSFDERRAHGLLTASSSLGLLFPPSLAVIVYGVTAQYSYGPERPLDLLALFKGGILPGVLIMAATTAYGILSSRISRFVAKSRSNTVNEPANDNAQPENATVSRGKLHDGVRSLIGALPEIAVPFIVAALFFTGYASIFETAALSVAYVIIVGLVRRDFNLTTLFGALRHGFIVIGGTLILLTMARGLNCFIVDSGIPTMAAEFVTTHINSYFVFLLLVNVLVLASGCLMDIFSGILIFTPILIPMADAFGINPIHFGVIFIANHMVGLLTPPVGMNLLLASYAFEKPVGTVWRHVVPYFLVQLGVVLVITYVPWLTMVFAK